MPSPRYLFGGGVSDFAIAPPSRNGGFVVAAPSLVNGTFWSAQTGGVQYTDLQTSAGGVTSTVATDKDGSLNPFYGPPGVDGGWLDFGGGDRAFVGANRGQDAHVSGLVADRSSATAGALTSFQAAALARTPDSIITGAITRDASGAATSATVTWPDGTTGTYTALVLSTAFPGAVDSYRITYGSPATKTYTQPTVTRDASGAAVSVPAITVT